MEVDILTIAGLVGVTLFVSVGKWLVGLRQWLLGFTNWSNPLRILGDLLTCTVSVGFVVGVLWALARSDSWANVVITGGFISLVAYTTDEALALMDAAVRKLVGGGGSPAPPMPIPRMPPPPEEEEPALPDGAMSEDQAHAMIGGKDGVADASAVRAARAVETKPVQNGRLKS